MSKTIDSRIVEMRFDNKQFEAGAKQTMGTLDRLKEALKLPDSGKALENLDKAAKNVKLDGISAGIEALEKRFSTLGIVGMRVIENITDGLMNRLSAAVNFVSDSIVSGGIKRAMNIENAHFQLQALLKDEEKVQAVMANAMESVDGTAYAYDEAAKAASQFAASGVQAGDEMLAALKGITGVAAMTNSQFEDISRIFTTVAGNGRLMGDQLLQLSSRGLNAASTLADYYREVRGQSKMTEATIREMVTKGQISFKTFSDAMTWAFGDSAKRANETFTGAMSNMKSALARIGAGFISPLVEQNGELVQLFNALRIKINDVKSALVFDEQKSAISGLAKVTDMTKDEVTELFAAIKENGSVTIAQLDEMSRKGPNAYSALLKYINGVSDGSIRATYSTKNAIQELTNGTKVSIEDIKRFTNEGKIDLAMFTSAMETEFGIERTLSKQFTDWFQDYIHTIVEAINSADMTKPMEIFYYWVESIKNIVKGLLSILKPVGKAFSEVFFSFNIDDVISFSEAIEKLTSKFKLSEKGSKNLHDAFKGIFDVGKLLVDIFVKLAGAIIPINKPVREIGDSFLDLVGLFGRALTSFTNMIRSSTLLKRAFEGLKSGFSFVFNGLSSLIKIVREFVSKVSKLEGTTKLINAVTNAFKKLSSKTTKYIDSFIKNVGDFLKSIFNLEDIDLSKSFSKISDAFSSLASGIENFSLQTVIDAFDNLKKKFKDLGDLAMSNEGFATFVRNLKKYGEDLKEAFTLDNLLDRIEKIMDVFGKFFSWIKETIGPAFKDFKFGNLLAAGGGFGIIYATIKGFKSLENISKSIKAIPDLFVTLKGTLVAYQKDLKADMLLKIAGAIAVLAVAITILSFADMDRAWEAAIMLGLVGAALVLAVGYFVDAAKKTKSIDDAAFMLSKAANNLTKALKWKAIGSAIKDFGKSILMIGLTIIAMGLMYKKDPEAMKMGALFVGGITAALVAIMALGSIAGKFMGKGMKNFSGLLRSVTGLTIGLMIVVMAMDKLFKITLPDDYGKKLFILAGLMIGMGVLALILGLAGRIASGGTASGMKGLQLPGGLKWAKSFMSSSNGGSLSAGPIIASAASLYVMVMAIEKLFKMNLPDDYGKKMGIFAGIIVGMGFLMLAIGAASKLAGGTIKATSTILAMCIFIGTIVAALYVLAIMPADKLRNGALALGGILLALAASLYGAGKIGTKDSYKTVLAMAFAIGAITASLAVLAMIPVASLVKSAVALGSILLILALDFKEVSKITNEQAWTNIAAMIMAVLGISFSLYILADQPWDKLLGASASLSLVLLAIAESLNIISKTKGLKIDKIGLFLLATTSLIPIGIALYKLSEQPWDGMLASAIALSAVVLAFSAAFSIISKSKPDLKAIGIFVGASAGVGVIALSLYGLAKQPFDKLLGAGIALSATLLAFAGAFTIISMTKPDLAAMATFLLASAGVGLIALSLYVLADKDWKNLLGAAAALSLVLVAMSGAMAICSLVGVAAPAALTGIALLDLFIANFALVLAALGAIFQSDGAKQLLSGGAEILVQIGQAIGDFVGAIINGVLTGISSALPQIATDLSTFMDNLQPFINGAKNIDNDSLASVGFLAGIIIALTATEIIQGIASLFGLSLVDVADELSEFIDALQPFLEGIKDIKEEPLRACALLGEMIKSLTASEVISGIGEVLGLGKKSLSDFGEELASFGPSIAQFAEDVKDVQPSAVEGAAAAAEIMATTAKKLPSKGGLKAKIFGDKSLAQFGAELLAFGPSIVLFSTIVKGVDPSSVEGASSVADMMSDLANGLPSLGGFKAQIFGDKSLAEFGSELLSFGPAIKLFANIVKGINPASVLGVSIITKIMSNLADNLPTTDSLWNKIFGGGTVKLSDFGTELVNFGQSMTEFSSSISDINLDQMGGLITIFSQLVDLANTIGGTSANGLNAFASQVTKLGSDLSKNVFEGVSLEDFGESLVQEIVNGINNGKPLALETIKLLGIAIVEKFKIMLPGSLFNIFGQNIMLSLINGLNKKKPLLSSTIGNICADIINKFRTSLPNDTFKVFGENIILWIVQGMDSKKYTAQQSIAQICNLIIDTFRNNLPESVFRDIGANAAIGLKNGIESKAGEIAQAAASAAQKAVDSARLILKEHSPSKVTTEMGEFFSIGLVNGIINKLRAISLASTEAANEAVEPVKKAIYGITSIIDSGDFDVDPVIRPTIDLTEVQRGVREIGSLMDQTYDLSSVYDKIMDVSSSFSRRNNKSETDSESVKSNNTEGTKYEFNQYNYSPKALNRSEIYRNTNNQFSAFRKAVNPS